MAKFIDVNELIRDVEISWNKDNHRTIEASLVHKQEHNHLMHIINRQPSADVVEVVRCKDCKYYVANYCTRDIKGRTNMFYMDSIDFCSYGKKVE